MQGGAAGEALHAAGLAALSSGSRPSKPSSKALEREATLSGFTSYRTVAARALKEDGKAKVNVPAELPETVPAKGRGGTSRSAEKHGKEGRGRSNKSGGPKDASAFSCNSNKSDKKNYEQEKRLQEEIRLLCSLPVLDEKLESPQELLRLKTLFVGEISNGIPRRKSECLLELHCPI